MNKPFFEKDMSDHRALSKKGEVLPTTMTRIAMPEVVPARPAAKPDERK